jgi:hypothetical protein
VEPKASLYRVSHLDEPLKSAVQNLLALRQTYR